MILVQTIGVFAALMSVIGVVLAASKAKRPLLRAAVADKARAQGARTLELGAQYDKQGFYEAVGFAPYGEPYLDEGYPHVPMRMAL